MLRTSIVRFFFGCAFFLSEYPVSCVFSLGNFLCVFSLRIFCAFFLKTTVCSFSCEREYLFTCKRKTHEKLRVSLSCVFLLQVNASHEYLFTRAKQKLRVSLSCEAFSCVFLKEKKSIPCSCEAIATYFFVRKECPLYVFFYVSFKKPKPKPNHKIKVYEKNKKQKKSKKRYTLRIERNKSKILSSENCI